MIIPRRLSGWSHHPPRNLILPERSCINTYFVRRVSARLPPHNVQQSGPRYTVEQAIASANDGTKGPQGSPTATDFFCGQKSQMADDTLIPPGAPQVPDEGTGPGKPSLPGWLASARARETDDTQSGDSTSYPFITGPFSEFQLQPETPQVTLHSASVSYQHQHQHQHQYGEQYQSSSMAEPSRRAPSFQDMQQQTNQHQLQHSDMTANNRQQLLSNSTRSPSIHSSSSTPATFSQSGLPAQALYQSQHQHNLQNQPSPNTSTYYQEQPSLVSPSSYVQPSPDRSTLGQRLIPPDTHDTGVSSHMLHQPQTYWSNQTSNLSPTFAIPETHTLNRPASPALYDRARGAVVAVPATTMQLPHPHPTSLATPFTSGTGYYVRAAGTLRKFPG